jgi:hypothetical protein
MNWELRMTWSGTAPFNQNQEMAYLDGALDEEVHKKMTFISFCAIPITIGRIIRDAGFYTIRES